MAQIETKKTTPANIKVSAKGRSASGGKVAAVKKTVKSVAVVKPEVKEVEKVATKLFKFSHPDLKVSPRKLRLVVAAVKKMTPAAALEQLHFTNSNSARLLDTVLTNAVNTAKNSGAIAETLKFSEVTVDEGKKTKRMDKSHGSRFARGIIIRRHSRLNIVLSGTITG